MQDEGTEQVLREIAEIEEEYTEEVKEEVKDKIVFHES